MPERKRPFIIEHFPGLKGKLPWTSLGDFPTPVQKMEKLAEMLGHKRLYVKRDDLSGKDYGGNKVRKLEFALADAIWKGKKTVLTTGAVGSNHVLATSVYASKLGMKTVGAFAPQPVQENLRTNILANCMLGCEIEYTDNEMLLPLGIIRSYFKSWIKTGQSPYFLWIGGSSALGVLGYVEAAFEIKAQVQNGECPEPDFIFLPAGSGGSLAGLAAGIKLCGLKSVPVGVRVVDHWMTNEKTVSFMANRSIKFLRKRDPEVPDIRVGPSDVLMLHDYFGTAYARYTRAAVDAIELVRDLEGLVLEGTYSGKAMAGFMDFVKRPENNDKTAMFITTYNSRPLQSFLAECPGEEILPDEIRKYFDEDIAPVDQ